MSALFDVKNAYYIGNYQQSINEAQKLKGLSPELQLERDIFLYRSYIGQKKYRVVIDEINSSSHVEIKPLKYLAEYFLNRSKSESIIQSIEKELLNGEQTPTLIIVAATIYCHEKDYNSACKVLHDIDNIECMALLTQTYLRIDRIDLAKKEVKNMQEKDEDNTLTQLAQAWLNIAMGGEKLQEAYYIFQELIDKYGSSAVLLNGQSVTFICQGKYEEAESALQEAMDKDANNPDNLLNMMVLSQHLGKSIMVSQRYRSQLADSHGDHHFVSDYNKKEAEFDELVQSYSINAGAQ